MIIQGAEKLKESLTNYPFHQRKAVFNENGILIFPASTQHNTMKADGISYEDDYKGNALAVVFDAMKFKIRFHSAFPQERVIRILKELLMQDGLTSLRGLSATYHGEALRH